MQILYSSRFRKDLRKLSKELQIRAIERESWFRKDPHDLRLKTHALKGKLAGLYSFSVSNSYRILFKFVEEGGYG